MLFNSMDFLAFFPIVVLTYFIVPGKVRTFWLLLASYYFYMSWNAKYAVLIFASTFITFLSGIFMERCPDRYKKTVLTVSLVSNLGILAVFKYADFFLSSIFDLLNRAGITVADRSLGLILPVGISFYTFQALGYSFDVYRKKIPAERNFLKYALFVSFFPQLVAGPIERSENLLTQIQGIDQKSRRELVDIDRITDGLLLMIWGFMQKLVIADRISPVVKHIYDNYSECGAKEIILATVLFAFQIYCDFGGYTNIAIGAARVMDIRLMKNFRQPYLAFSVKDFWRRWHISLTDWFRDYLYIPLGGNRKGVFRKELNTLIVFTVSGLWHGASWNFVAWGFIHAMLLIINDLWDMLRERIQGEKKEQEKTIVTRMIGAAVTFVCVDLAWIFFAAGNLKKAVNIILQPFTSLKGSLLWDIALNHQEKVVLIAAILILLAVDLMHEMDISVFNVVKKQRLFFRWILYAALIWGVVIFGVYGSTAGLDRKFIYFQF